MAGGSAATALITVIVVLALGRAAASEPELALAAFVLAVATIIVVLRPEVLLLVLVAGLPWESELAYPSTSLTLLAIIRLILPELFLVRALVRRDRLIVPRFLAPFSVFLLLVLLSLMVSPDLGEGITKTLRYLIFATSLFVAIQLLRERATLLRVIRVLAISASAASMYALVGFLSGKLTRAAGPIADPNDFSYVLVTVIPLAAFLFMEDRRWRVLWGASLLILFAGILATLSRGAYVGLAGLLLWGILTRRVSIVALLGAIAMAVAIFLVAFAFFGSVVNQRIAGREQVASSSAAARTAFWSAAARMSLSRPLIGVGPERFDAEREKYLRNSPVPLEGRKGEKSQMQGAVHTAHDSYLEIAAENGIPAALAFGFFLFAIWISLRDSILSFTDRVDDQGKRLAAALQGALITAVLSGVFLSGQLEAPFWLVGVLAGGLTAGSAARVPSVPGRRWAAAEPLSTSLSDRATLPVSTVESSPRTPSNRRSAGRHI